VGHSVRPSGHGPWLVILHGSRASQHETKSWAP
jgi:hypothetical protein